MDDYITFLENILEGKLAELPSSFYTFENVQCVINALGYVDSDVSEIIINHNASFEQFLEIDKKIVAIMEPHIKGSDKILKNKVLELSFWFLLRSVARGRYLTDILETYKCLYSIKKRFYSTPKNLLPFSRNMILIELFALIQSDLFKVLRKFSSLPGKEKTLTFANAFYIWMELEFDYGSPFNYRVKTVDIEEVVDEYLSRDFFF